MSVKPLALSALLALVLLGVCPAFAQPNGADLVNPVAVYILECADGTYYTGVTANLERRLRQQGPALRCAQNLAV